MIRRPPGSTRTYTLFPYTTLCRSLELTSAQLRSLGGSRTPSAFPDDIAGRLKRKCANEMSRWQILLWKLTSGRSEEHTSELQSLMRISYAVFCLKKKNHTPTQTPDNGCHINITMSRSNSD